MIKGIKKMFSSKNNYSFMVSLIGRPNVGKSTLFNKFYSLSSYYNSEKSIISNIPNTTTNPLHCRIDDIFQCSLNIYDTGGLFSPLTDRNKKELLDNIHNKSLQMIHKSDLLLFLLDAKEGVTPIDLKINNYLKQNNLKDKTILIANKNDNNNHDDYKKEFIKLGYNDFMFLSAEQGDNFQDLLSIIKSKISRDIVSNYIKIKEKRRSNFDKLKTSLINDFKNTVTEDIYKANIKDFEKDIMYAYNNHEFLSDFDEEENILSLALPLDNKNKDKDDSQIISYTNSTVKILFLGRPNAGKSTLCNNIIKQNDKFITSSVKYTTTDSVSETFTYKKFKIKITDAAGLEIHFNNPHKKDDFLKNINASIINQINNSHVIVVVAEATKQLQDFDFQLLTLAHDCGKAVILCIHKMDLIDKKYRKEIKEFLENQIKKNMNNFYPNLSIVYTDKDRDNSQILDNALSLYMGYNRRIGTGELNDWLNKFKKLNHTPKDKKIALKIRFVTQLSIRPPTFVLFVNDIILFRENMLRFIRRNLIEEFNMTGVAIKVKLRGAIYKKNKSKADNADISDDNNLNYNRNKLRQRKVQDLYKVRNKNNDE